MTFPPRAFAAFLFDMDGTLIDSFASAERAWTRWAHRHALDPQAVLTAMHGARAIDTIRRLSPPGTDPEAEAALLTRWEVEDVGGVVAIAGACRFLSSVPTDRWAMVTSAPRHLAERRLAAAGLPLPKLMIAAEDVSRGKPAPDGFAAAAEALGTRATDCLAWEDSAPGIAAAQAAGCAVAVINGVSGLRPEDLPVFADFDGLAVEVSPEGLRVRAR